MGTGITATVFADGQRLDDGCTDAGPEDPVVLTGLEIAWGRDTTVDQPEASTCSFDILDPPRGGSFVDRLRTGTRIDVTASGSVYPDPTEPVWPDPGFETALPGTYRSNALVTRSTRRASSGTYSLRLDPVDASRRSTVNIAPAPFSPAGTDPDAWDAIPTTTPGQTWSFGTSLFAPPGATVIVRPILYTGPYAGSGTVLSSPTLAITGDGTWQTVTGQFVPNRAGAWVGISVSTYPTGLAWDQLPPTMTWDSLTPADVRANLADDPHTLGNNTSRWRYQVGTGGAYEPAWMTDTDTPDGQPGYRRLTITTAGTAGNEGPYYRQDGGLDGQVGDTLTLSFYYRTSADTPRNVTVTASTRLGGAQVGNTAEASVPLVVGEWVRLVVTVTATAAFDGFQIWARELLADAPVAGTTIDCTMMLAEMSPTLGTYFDGDTPDTDTTTYAWTGEPNASTSTASTAGAGSWANWQWDDFGAVFVDDVTVLAPAQGTESTVLVYSGRVASLEAGYDDEAGAPVISVECVDFTADMENVNVGSEPWQVEPMGTRFQRIVTATGMPVTAEIDASVAGILVSWRDVDSQAAAGLLAELAESVDAVMWSATHQVTGPYLRVEDPANRQSQFWLQYAGGVVVIVPNPGGVTAMDLSACDLLRDDVSWKQDTQDVVTRASVSWQEQGVDDDGKNTTTEHTVTIIDDALEDAHGVRGLSLSTQLQAEADAHAVAEKLLARTSISDWRASGLVLDDAWLDDPDDEDVTRLLTLLDGTSRNGLAVSLVGLPAWSPTGATVPVYLEGGKYTFEDGAWVLDLTVSNATAQGASTHWDDLDPTWTWDMFDPAITWDDLRGVGVAPEGA